MEKLKINMEEMESMTMEGLNNIYIDDDYKSGILDAYLRIYGISRGLEEYLHDELGQDVPEFLEDYGVKQDENGDYYLLII